MYLDHFQLSELPFRLSPDPSFMYLSQIHSRAKAYMESTIWFTDGFVVITGEIGSGKTTLIETFLKELEQDVVVAQINQTQVSPIEFLQSVLAQFGFSPFKMRKAELLATLNSFLIEQYSNGRKVLLIVDEAQNLTNKVLEEMRMLSGVETTKEKVLRIILAGQPELNEKLDSAGTRAAEAARQAALPPHRAQRDRRDRLRAPPAAAWPARAIARSSSPRRSRSSTDTRAASRGWSTRCAIRRCWRRLRRTATTVSTEDVQAADRRTAVGRVRGTNVFAAAGHSGGHARRRSSRRSAGWCCRSRARRSSECYLCRAVCSSAVPRTTTCRSRAST